MAEKTGIAWTDSTFNAWWGCVKVGPECANCYAETLDRDTSSTGESKYWGIHTEPRKMSPSNWRNPRVWNRDHEKFYSINGRNRRVFCGSMMDWCDKNAPVEQRNRLWTLIKETPNLNWMLLTKRAPNIVKYLPKDWNSGYENVALGVSVGDKKHGLQRIEHLRKVPAKIRFLSVEPLLEDLGDFDLEGIDWVIVGGESGKNFRPMNMDWAYRIYIKCKLQGIPFFFKQTGGVDGGTHLFYQQVVQEFPNGW
jgi:protein gp37